MKLSEEKYHILGVVRGHIQYFGQCEHARWDTYVLMFWRLGWEVVWLEVVWLEERTEVVGKVR